MSTEIPPVIFAYIDGLKRHDVDGIAQTVSDDLAFITSNRRLTKEQFLQMLRGLYAAFPDWQYRHDPPERRGPSVAIQWYQGGTQTGTFAMPGMDPIPATLRQVQIPPQYFVYTVHDNMITEICPNPVPGGAPGGILEQIGATSPPI